MKASFNKLLKQTQQDYQAIQHIDNMKVFAEEAKQKTWPAALFALKRQKTPDFVSFARDNCTLDTLLQLCGKV